MREFDEHLLEILKTETRYEKRIKEDPQERERYYEQVQRDSGKEETYASSVNKVSVGRVLRYTDAPKRRNARIVISYVASGKAVLHIGEKDIHLKQGDIFIPNQYTLFSRDALGENDIIVNFVFKPQFLSEACSALEMHTSLSEFLQDTLRKDISWNRYLHFTNMEDVAVHDLAEAITSLAFPYLNDENIMNGSCRESRLLATMTMSFLVCLSRNLDSLAEDSPTDFDEVIRQSVIDYITEDYKTASLKELAEITNQSESSLSRQIKRLFGFSFKDLLLENRFSRAVTLLQQTNLPVSDVADAVGYENTSFFYRRFRQRYGISPKDYRKHPELLKRNSSEEDPDIEPI